MGTGEKFLNRTAMALCYKKATNRLGKDLYLS
uniref:Uncharacterized protein n=1 Tax=Trichinella nativa TaxID=6335 RepID=A0A0V1KI00_9BILA